MRVVGTIEARMGSTRLPGKSLMEIYGGMPLIEAVTERFRMCRNVDAVWVATTTEPADDAIAQWCRANEVNCFRGSEQDVLDRVAKTAMEARANAVVQMGADSAYLDFKLIDAMVKVFKRGGCDYLCNDLELTYPLGIYAHVIRVSCLVALNRRAELSEQEREDVVRYIYEHPNEYRVANITAPPEFAYPGLRLTIDYPEDLGLARTIYARFGGCRFTTGDVIGLYRDEPELFKKTRGLIQRSAPFLKRAANE